MGSTSKNGSLRDALRFIRGNNQVFALTDLLGNFARGMVTPYAYQDPSSCC
jgi:hypothetical protein